MSKVGCWFPGFIISAIGIFVLSFVMISFPEKLKKTNLTYKEKRTLRKKTLSQTNTADTSTTTASSSKTSMDESNKDLTTVTRRRILSTINEAPETSDAPPLDQNYEYLDSISSKLPHHNQQVATSQNIFLISDSISSDFSNVTSSSTSITGGVAESNTSEKQFITSKSQRDKRICCDSLSDKLVYSKLKLTGKLDELIPEDPVFVPGIKMVYNFLVEVIPRITCKNNVKKPHIWTTSEPQKVSFSEFAFVLLLSVYFGILIN